MMSDIFPPYIVHGGGKESDAEGLQSECESELEDENVKLAETAKNSIYNRDGLLDKFGYIRWPKNVEWTQAFP